MNLKPKVEKFEGKMTFKMIIGLIAKALLKSNIYSFELIFSHGLVSGITSLSMFLLMRPESLLLAGLAKCFEKMLLFLSGNVLVFSQWRM